MNLRCFFGVSKSKDVFFSNMPPHAHRTSKNIITSRFCWKKIPSVWFSEMKGQTLSAGFFQLEIRERSRKKIPTLTTGFIMTQRAKFILGSK